MDCTAVIREWPGIPFHHRSGKTDWNAPAAAGQLSPDSTLKTVRNLLDAEPETLARTTESLPMKNPTELAFIST